MPAVVLAALALADAALADALADAALAEALADAALAEALADAALAEALLEALLPEPDEQAASVNAKAHATATMPIFFMLSLSPEPITTGVEPALLAMIIRPMRLDYAVACESLSDSVSFMLPVR